MGQIPDADKTRLGEWFEENARGVNLGTSAAAEKERMKIIAGSRKQILLLKLKFSLCRQHNMLVPSLNSSFAKVLLPPF